MRILAFLFALLGAAGSGLVGVIWNEKLKELDGMVQAVRAANDTKKDAEVAAALSRIELLTQATYALMAAIPLGVIGGIVALKRKGKLAAFLLLAAYAAPITLLVAAMGTADPDVILAPGLYSAGLPIAALFSLFVRPYIPPRSPRRKKPGLSKDDDFVG